MMTFLHCYRHFRRCGMGRFQAVKRAHRVVRDGF